MTRWQAKLLAARQDSLCSILRAISAKIMSCRFERYAGCDLAMDQLAVREAEVFFPAM
jgi:hypothetical protein